MLNRLKTAVWEAVSGAFAVIMTRPGTNPPAASHSLPGSYSTEDCATRTSIVPKDAKMSSVGQSARPRSGTVKEHTKTRSYPETDPDVASENIIADFQQALLKSEKILDGERATNHKLSGSYNKALTTNEEQAKLIEMQNVTIAQLQQSEAALHDVLKTIVFDHLSPYAKKHATLPARWCLDDILRITKALSKDAADANANAAYAATSAAQVASLTEQVQMLQKEMLSNVEKVHVASDEELAKDFRVIVALVKTLSRTVPIAENQDFVAKLGSGLLLQDVPLHLSTGRGQMKVLVEACIWSMLVEKVFRTPFVIFGGSCEVLSANWSNIYLSDHCNGWPRPTTLSETWRYTTVESMLELVDQDVIVHGKKKDKAGMLERDVINLRNETLHLIGRRLNSVSSANIMQAPVQNIINKALAFALQISLQRVRLQVTYPEIGDIFDADMMKSTSEADCEDVEHGTIAFVVNPGLTKWGDTHGKNLDQRYDIVPSLVKIEVPVQQKVVETKPVSLDWAKVVKRGNEEALVFKGGRGKGGDNSG
ncbi:hypothetical protein CFE70_006033 [Pyrenophora teres f. teres 0-1]